MSDQQPAEGRGRFTGLWRHEDFLRLWAGQTVSVFGSYVGGFALPLVAILTLDASPIQVALLSAAGHAPGMVLGLFAGVWVDRLRRRPLLIAADLGRALLLGSIPLAWALGRLGMTQLYAVALLSSGLTVLFDVAYGAYLPSLVRREQLVEGNSKLEATNSVAEVAGFGLAGVLVQALRPPLAMLVDAFTFLASALALSRIRAPEPSPAPPEGAERAPGGVLREVREGLRLIRRDRLLRALAGANATQTFFAYIFVAVLTLYVIEELRLSPALWGAVAAVGGISALVGALFVERLTRRFGVGRTMLGSLVISTTSTLFIPLAGGPVPLAAGMLATEQAFDGTGMAYHINRVSLIQAITPPQLLGRVNAGGRVLEQAGMLCGLLLGGVLGERIGLRPTVFVGVLGMFLAIPWLYFSPLRGLLDLPAPAGT